MEPTGVSNIVTISDQSLYIKIEILRCKNPTEIRGASSEACSEFTVDHSTISRWGNCFHVVVAA